MIKRTLIRLILLAATGLFMSFSLSAQRTKTRMVTPAPVVQPPGRSAFSQALSLNLESPVAIFQRSHRAGIGVEYAWSRKRIGISEAKHALGLILKGGGEYFIGKHITTAGYPFVYADYLYLHAMGGVVYNPWTNLQFAISAGPSLGIYAGNTSVGIMSEAAGTVYTKHRFGFGTMIRFREHHQANALWSLGVRGLYAF